MTLDGSVQTKMLAVSVLFLGALVAVAALVLIEVVGSSFETLERKDAHDRVQAISKTIQRDVSSLDVLVQDWAYWDETYAFIAEQSDDYVSGNLIEETFVGALLNLILLQGIDGRVIWAGTYDLQAERFQALQDFAQGSPLLARLTERAFASDDGVCGLLGTSAGPMMIAARPILTSAEAGPPRGLLIMGRLLTKAVLADVGDALGLSIEAHAAVGSERLTASGGMGVSESNIRIAAAGPDSLQASVTLPDLFGQPLVVLSTPLERSVMAIGRTAQTMGLAITGLAGVVLITVFLLSQQAIVIGPLRRLTSRVETIGLQGEPDVRLPDDRRDELGLLAKSFNGMMERVMRLTNFDAVTDLPNRRLFYDRANQVLREERGSGGKAAILFIDLDDFKAINDTRGHAVGDRLLKVIGEELSGLIRKTDLVARFGGDEFVLLIHPVDAAAEIEDISGRLQRRFRHPFAVSGSALFTNASIGVAVFPDDADDVDTLVSLADAAMYQAKGEGGGRVAFLDTEAHRDDGRWRNLEQDFRQAMRLDQLHLVFQPQVDLQSGKVVGHEALVRWRHPDLGPLAAGRFIHLAERADNFVHFDAWVLRAACGALARAEHHGGAPLERVSVNICARHVQSPGLVETVMDALQEADVAPERLTLEITETVMVSRPETAARVLLSLRAHGVRVAIDDFGTGYASLAALHRFPVDVLKIDRSFVVGLPNDHSALAITKASLALAKSLGLAVIAEGVETPLQRDALIEAGCKTAQGFLWGHLPEG